MLLKLSFSSHTCQPLWFPFCFRIYPLLIFPLNFWFFFFLMVDLCRSFLYIPDINPLLALDITLISSQSVLERAYLPGPELALRVSMKFTCWDPASHSPLNLSSLGHPPWSRNNWSIPFFLWAHLLKVLGCVSLSRLSSKISISVAIKFKLVVACGRRMGVVIGTGTWRSF